MDSWLSCGTATTLTHTPMPCFSFAEETSGNQGFTLRQGWFVLMQKDLDGSRSFPVATQCLGSTPAYKTGIPMAHGGLAIDQPKAIKAGSRKKTSECLYKTEKNKNFFPVIKRLIPAYQQHFSILLHLWNYRTDSSRFLFHGRISNLKSGIIH